LSHLLALAEFGRYPLKECRSMAYHLIPGFIIRIGEQSNYGHLQGGPRSHSGADCPTCRRALIRLWQFDCHDPRFVVVGTDDTKAFGSLAALPLYYCWTCGSELTYRIINDDSIDVLQSQGGNPSDDFPYADYPDAYPEMPLRLYRPDDLPKLVRKHIVEELDDPIPDDEKQALSDFFGRPVRSTLGDLWWHQFGGEPWLVQGDEEIACPNPECEHHSDGETMKIIAAICNDPLGGLPMIESIETVEANGRHFNHWVQVVFHICPLCLTVQAGNRCD
jgi:hypothetical protein